jgi:hypothetical protein
MLLAISEKGINTLFAFLKTPISSNQVRERRLKNGRKGNLTHDARTHYKPVVNSPKLLRCQKSRDRFFTPFERVAAQPI